MRTVFASSVCPETRQVQSFNIEPAGYGPQTAAVLTDLVIRSKASCTDEEGQLLYTPDQIEAKRPYLVVTESHLAKPSLRFYIAKHDRGVLVGMACLRVPDDKRNRNGELRWMFVEPDVKGSGCGRALWNTITAVARNEGLLSFQICFEAAAEAFYRRVGGERLKQTSENQFRYFV